MKEVNAGKRPFRFTLLFFNEWSCAFSCSLSIVAFFSFAATNFAKTADLWLLHLISGVKVERGGDGSRRWLNKHLRHPRSFHLQNEKKTLFWTCHAFSVWVLMYVCDSIFWDFIEARSTARRLPTKVATAVFWLPFPSCTHTLPRARRKMATGYR